jgi:hypothetical protein
VNALGRLAWRRAVNRGFFGDSNLWLVVGIVIGARRVVKRFSRSGPRTVFSEELEPGQTLVISHPLPGS